MSQPWFYARAWSRVWLFAPHREKPFPSGIEQERVVGPDFEDHRAAESPGFQPLQQSPNPCIVLRRWTGEQRQVTILVPPIFVHVQVNDRDRCIKLVMVSKVVVASGGTEIGVPHIKAHADMVQVFGALLPQRLEQGVEIFRRVFRGVLDGEAQTPTQLLLREAVEAPGQMPGCPVRCRDGD